LRVWRDIPRLILVIKALGHEQVWLEARIKIANHIAHHQREAGDRLHHLEGDHIPIAMPVRVWFHPAISA
jgi:hypothetical protein